jgi:hypothetical protein
MSKAEFLYTLRNIVLLHKGVIYGGFNRDMILYKKDRLLPEDERTYPMDMDVVIELRNYQRMMCALQYERGYTLAREDAKAYGFHTEPFGNLSIKERFRVSKGEHTTFLDIIILVPVKGTVDTDMINNFFTVILPEFDVNKLVLTRDGERYITSDGSLVNDEDTISDIKSQIHAKVAILQISIDRIKEQRIIHMLDMGFRVISADKSIEWFERANDEAKECMVCHTEINGKWLSAQNIYNVDCECSTGRRNTRYVCAGLNEVCPGVHKHGCIFGLRNKCLLCHQTNHAFG